MFNRKSEIYEKKKLQPTITTKVSRSNEQPREYFNTKREFGKL